MDGVIEKMSSAQILAAIGILTGGFVFLTMILTIYRYQVRALEDETALRREQQQGELALRNRIVEKGGAGDDRQLEALLAGKPLAPPVRANDLDVQLASRLGRIDADPDLIALTLKQAVASDSERKQSIIEVIDRLEIEDADPTAILAAVGPLCRPHAEKMTAPTGF